MLDGEDSLIGCGAAQNFGKGDFLRNQRSQRKSAIVSPAIDLTGVKE
jgi:hypothetical protein